MSNVSDHQVSTELELMSPAAITDYINNQRAILIKNLVYQRKYVTTLIQERETELKVLADMAVTKGLLRSGDGIRAEVRILRRRLLMLESKETELRKLQAKADTKTTPNPMQDEPHVARNFSRKISKDTSGGVWI